MEVNLQPILKFHGVTISNVNLNLINAIDPNLNKPLDLSIVPKVFFPEDNINQFTIIIELNIALKEYFDIYIRALGAFTLDKSTQEADVKPFINVNAPAIMFPYVRAFLSTLTANLGGGIQQMVLPPHFFEGELEEIKI